MKRLHYQDRMTFCKNPLAKQLLHLISEKKSNLALSADVTRCAEIIELAEKIGPEICVLKTHVDILEDFTIDFIQELTNLAKKQQFLIFEDRKFADIGNTVKLQYAKGIYRIADWADMINAHSLPGPGMIAGLSEIGMSKQRGLLLLAEMSSAQNLFDSNYTQKTLAMAKQFAEFVIGFIAQRKLSTDPGWIYLTPGVQFSQHNDSYGQQYITPEQAIIQNETDIIIVGRGIISAKDPAMTAKQYRENAWQAYLRSCGNE